MNASTSREAIEQRAVEWILQRDRDGQSDENRVALESWLAQDPRHREAYLQADEFWDATSGLKHWNPRDGRIDPDRLAPFVPKQRASRPALWAAAASVLMIVAVGGLWGLNRNEQSFSTPVGGYERIALEDGSILQLNTDTELKAAITRDRRTIRLLRGEAHFSVARDPQRPFEVRVGDAIARAVGTAFSVRVGKGGLELIVTEGKVLLLSNETERNAPLITAGQSARAEAGNVHIASLATPEVDRRLAWQDGYLSFDRRPLQQIADELNRYNQRHVSIEGEALKTLRLTGNFKATDLESFVAAVQSAARVRVEDNEGKLVIRAR